MGAEAYLLYYGVRLPVREDEIEPLETDTHPSVVSAERYGLDTWWGNFSTNGSEEYYLFIGKELAILGAEYAGCYSMGEHEFRQVAEETVAKLKAAGFTTTPLLWAQWEPDY